MTENLWSSDIFSGEGKEGIEGTGVMKKVELDTESTHPVLNAKRYKNIRKRQSWQ